jgi:PAS domain S-box-containing protein
MDELLNNAPCGFLVITDNGETVEANATLLKLLGYRREELIGTHVKKLFSVAGNIFYQTHFFPLLKLQGRIEEISLPMRNSAGQEVPVLVNAARREKDGAVFYDCVLMAMQQRHVYEDDILQAKKTAETANRTKEEFLSVVSHDLRTPLTSILGWIEILRGKENDTELVKKALAIIERGAVTQKTLIADILDFARISSGKLKIDTSPIDLKEIIAGAIEIVASAADAKEIHIQSDLGAESFVMGDRMRLQQVLWNLLSNAVKFTPKKGRVNITMSRSGPNVEIKVSDTGKGIGAEFLPHVFERFLQENKTETGAYSGLGLGLAITHHIVELHGGSITAESPGENKGAIFTVILPALAEASSLKT